LVAAFKNQFKCKRLIIFHFDSQRCVLFVGSVESTFYFLISFWAAAFGGILWVNQGFMHLWVQSRYPTFPFPNGIDMAWPGATKLPLASPDICLSFCFAYRSFYRFMNALWHGSLREEREKTSLVEAGIKIQSHKSRASRLMSSNSCTLPKNSFQF